MTCQLFYYGSSSTPRLGIPFLHSLSIQRLPLLDFSTKKTPPQPSQNCATTATASTTNPRTRTSTYLHDCTLLAPSFPISLTLPRASIRLLLFFLDPFPLFPLLSSLSSSVLGLPGTSFIYPMSLSYLLLFPDRTKSVWSLLSGPWRITKRSDGVV